LILRQFGGVDNLADDFIIELMAPVQALQFDAEPIPIKSHASPPMPRTFFRLNRDLRNARPPPTSAHFPSGQHSQCHDPSSFSRIARRYTPAPLDPRFKSPSMRFAPTAERLVSAGAGDSPSQLWRNVRVAMPAPNGQSCSSSTLRTLPSGATS